MNMMSEQQYRTKVYYGWCGKFLGGNIGAPYEGFKDVVPRVHLKLSDITNLANDDADYQIAWFEVLKAKGDAVTGLDLAEYAEKHIWYPFGEYGYSIKNIRMGINPPVSGTFNNRYWGNGMGSPIRSELWAYIYPGQPRYAAQMAVMDSGIDHTSGSTWGEAFLSAMQSSCFECGMVEAIATALSCIPSESRVARMVRDVLAWSNENHCESEIRRRILSRYGHPDFTNSLQNIAFTLVGLLRGGGDFLRTMEMLINFGYDTDCTCATAGATLGILHGEDTVTSELLGCLQDEFVIGVDVELEHRSVRRLAEEVCDYAIAHGHFNAPDSLNLPYLGFGSGAIVDYVGSPVVSPEKPAKIRVLDPAWKLVDSDALQVVPDSDGCHTVALASEVSEVRDHYKLTFANDGEQRPVGFATPRLWHMKGPYFDCGEQQTDLQYCPHGGFGVNMPGILEIFANTASLERQYLDESDLLAGVVRGDVECDDTFFDGAEDILPFDEHIELEGPMCAYAWTYFRLDQPRQLWLVVGNNSPFALWVDGVEVIRDTKHRSWMPYNNDALVSLGAGVHSVMVKAIRTDTSIKFSLGFKPFEERHFHRSHFMVGLNWVYATGAKESQNPVDNQREVAAAQSGR